MVCLFLLPNLPTP